MRSYLLLLYITLFACGLQMSLNAASAKKTTAQHTSNRKPTRKEIDDILQVIKAGDRVIDPAAMHSGITVPDEITHQPQTEKSSDNTTPSTEEEETISLNFESTSLATIVNFLADRKNINIMPLEELKNATVTLHNHRPLTLSQAWDMLPTLLEINGFTMNKVGNVYRIVSSKDNSKEALPIYSSATGTTPSMLPNTDQVIRYIYFLRNIKSENAASILAGMFTDRNAVDVNRDLDVLFIKEKSLNIKSAMQIIEELDLGGLRQSVQIIRLKYESPENIARFFNNELLGKNQKQQDNSIRFLSLNKPEAGYFSTNIKILPDSLRNALILMGQEKDIARVRDFINTYLDIAPHAPSRVHIKEIKYLPADRIQKLLASIIKPPPGTPKDGGPQYFEDVNIVAETPQGNDSSYGSGNRLIVTCSPDDWTRLDKIIQKLDLPQAQIALEVMVVDVSTDASKQLGAQLRQKTLHNLTGDIKVGYGTAHLNPSTTTPLDNPSMIDNLPKNTGAAFAIGPADNIWAVAKAVLTENNSNIIAQPFMIVGNRKPCVIDSGEKRRYAGAYQNVQGLQSYSELPAQNTITITPSINKNGIIDVTVKLDFSDFSQPSQSGDQQATRKTRIINTRATMASGEVLVLGGLAKTNASNTHYQTPILSSIPIIGRLFKYEVKRSVKTHLFVFIRPSVMKPEFSGVPDDYTQLKIDYAKRQIFNFQSYGNDADPIGRFFFKPQSMSTSQSTENTKKQRFSWIDNFVERRYTPNSADLRRDPYYRSGKAAKPIKSVAALLQNKPPKNPPIFSDVEKEPQAA